MAIRFVYITASNHDEAERIGRELVERQLAACVNILDGMKSIYRWQGKIQEISEVVLIAKTTEQLVDKLMHAVRDLHSYECPCVVALPVESGNPDYLKWIRSETL